MSESNPDGATTDRGSKPGLAEQVLGELAAWSPRERRSEFRTWLRGSLSLIHLHVLSVLESDGPVSMSALAEELDVSLASVTGIVTRMEQRRLVERRHGTADRRVVLVHPTRRGAGVFRVIELHRQRRLKKVLDQLSAAELQAFLVGIRAMRAAQAAVPFSPPSLAADGASEAAASEAAE
ncbi:MAG: MarR family transcriptional regulator [Chloroflexi bacterium]|nr:MarR family transcriptional regulator [Chloroflexota bacterium]